MRPKGKVQGNNKHVVYVPHGRRYVGNHGMRKTRRSEKRRYGYIKNIRIIQHDRNHGGKRCNEPLQANTNTPMKRTHPQADEPISVIEAVKQHGIGAFRANGANYDDE